MPRFVIQEHQKRSEPTHWDLMLEQGQVLVTYRLDLAPREILCQPATATPIADHDRRFLTYEGPVNQGLGQVRIVDAGTYEMRSLPDSVTLFAFEGNILKGEFELVASQTPPGTLRHSNKTRFVTRSSEKDETKAAGGKGPKAC